MGEVDWEKGSFRKKNLDKNKGGFAVHGQENLIPFSERTEEEQREIRSKGGKASGKSRRQRKTNKQILELIMDMQLQGKIKKQMEDLGVNPDDLTYQFAVQFVKVQQALGGNIKAMDSIDDTMGESIKAKQLKETIRSNKAREKIESQRIVGGKTEDITQKAADIFVQLQKHKSDLLDYEEKSGDMNV